MQAWGVSDPGMVRKENQDAFSLEQLKGEGLLAIVCDGMGGARSGNIASRLALDVFRGEILRGYKPSMNNGKIEALLCSGVELANKAVYEQSCSGKEYNGMGTTLVAAIVAAGKAHIVNVGDSRLYHVGENGIQCVTTDHSFVQLMVQRGEITREEAKNHPGKNLITRAIGTEQAVEGDLYCVDFKAGDSLLLCTDGLSNVMADQEILFEVVHGAQKSDCCQRLLEIAKNRGAPDNVTAVLVSG